MNELILDGYNILIKESTSIKLVDENPYITQSGKYTYDVEIPLKGNMVNATVFNNMHRMDVTKEIVKKNAKLIINGHCIIAGTATVTSISDSSIKVQILSGNANINFLSKNDNMYIDELDLGDIVNEEGKIMYDIDARRYLSRIEDENKRLKRMFGEYGDTDFVFFPVGNQKNGVVFNNMCMRKMTQTTSTIFWQSFMYSAVSNIGDLSSSQGFACAQPYFCTVLKRIFETLGYKIVENQIENTVLKNIFIVNSQTGASYAQLLPHWTLNEFIEQVERFFGVVFKIDDQFKEVRLLARNSFWNGKIVYIDEILDEYTVNCDEEETTDISNANIAYDFENVDKYLKISDDVMEQVDIKVFDTYYELSNYYMGLSAGDKKKYIFETGGIQYICRDGNLSEVNQYRNLKRNLVDEDNELELRIVPVQMRTSRALWEGCAYDDFFQRWYPTKEAEFNVVIVNASEYINNHDNEQGNIQDLIEGGAVEISKNTHIEVAMNDGRLQYVQKDDGSASQLYPWPFVLTNDLLNGNHNRGFSFELNKVDERTTMFDTIYNKTTKVNTQCEIVIKFITDKMYDPMNLFVIHNKKYICKQIEYKITERGIDPVKTGYFYEAT